MVGKIVPVTRSVELAVGYAWLYNIFGPLILIQRHYGVAIQKEDAWLGSDERKPGLSATVNTSRNARHTLCCDSVRLTRVGEGIIR